MRSLFLLPAVAVILTATAPAARAGDPGAAGQNLKAGEAAATRMAEAAPYSLANQAFTAAMFASRARQNADYARIPGLFTAAARQYWAKAAADAQMAAVYADYVRRMQPRNPYAATAVSRLVAGSQYAYQLSQGR